jgi:hypothetical protein
VVTIGRHRHIEGMIICAPAYCRHQYYVIYLVGTCANVSKKQAEKKRKKSKAGQDRSLFPKSYRMSAFCHYLELSCTTKYYQLQVVAFCGRHQYCTNRFAARTRAEVETSQSSHAYNYFFRIELNLGDSDEGDEGNITRAYM